MFRTLCYNKYNLFFILLGLFFVNTLFGQISAKDYFEQAQKQFTNFKYFQATGSLQKALKLNPYYTDAQILLGDAYFIMGNYQSAWQIYLEAEKKAPNNPELLIKLARTKLTLAKNRNEVSATEYYLKKAYKIAPRNSKVALVYGEFYMKMNDYEKAMDYYNSLGETVDNPDIYINKSKIYQKWGQDEKALVELKKAENLDSDNYNVLLELGKIYRKLKQNSKALVYLNTAYSYNPKDRNVLQALADIYIQDKNYADASHKISQLILNDSSNPILYYNLAICYEALGDFDKAIEVLMQGLKFDYGNEILRIKAEEIAVLKLPLTHIARKNLESFYIDEGHNLLKNNQEQEALLFLKRALRINPLNIQTRMDIAYIYRKHSFLYEYLKLLKGGVFLSPQDNNLRDQLLLNQKFIFNSLENKEHLDSKPFVELEPAIRISDARIDNASYPFFSNSAQQVFLEALLNNHSMNAFIGSDNPNKEAQFDLKITIKPDADKVEMSLDITYIPTGEEYLHYNITEYGNNRIIHSFERLANYIQRDIPKVARILKINDHTAIINMGAQQGLKLDQSLTILNNPDLPNQFFIMKTIDPSWEIASAKVIELGENISKIEFKPLDRIVFNMVQQNQSIIVEKQGK